MRGWLTIIVVFAVLSAMVSLLGSVFGKTGLLILIVAIVAYFGTIYYKKRELQKRKEQARLRTQLLRSEIIPQRMLAAHRASCSASSCASAEAGTTAGCSSR